jgi:dTDP-4-dehydrorhamnose 3,5-epimerase
MKFNFTQTTIEGCILIKPQIHKDERGVLRRHFDSEQFNSNGIFSVVKQCNISENIKKHTLRGFHCQSGTKADAKILSCITGGIYNIVVDIRPQSKTFLKWESFLLDEKNKFSLHIPKECANAFLTLEPNTILHYYHSEAYNPSHSKGIRYNDPKFNFKWPNEPEIISEKDKSWPDFIG